MRSFSDSKKQLLSLLLVLLILFVAIALGAESTYDTGDGIRHYIVSRYSWKHPELLLYSWGKPFFTLLSSPFSQFGLMGTTVFNIFCGIASAFICYRIAERLKLGNALLATLFLCFTPCYFATLNSGLTEPLFGLVLIAAIYLVMLKHFGAAALLASFLPYVRAEGYLLLPLFLVVFLYHRKYIQTLLLAVGTALYTAIGAFYYKDLFWLNTQNPYKGLNSDIYGHGDLFYFASQYNALFGTPLTVLLLSGLIAIVISIVKRKRSPLIFPIEETVLICGSFLLYFIAHSVFWWKGLAGSLGLLRVMAGVAPCFALVCLCGFDWIVTPVLKRIPAAAFVLIPLTLFLVISSPFKHAYFPYRLDGEQQALKATGDWFRRSAFYNKKVFYLHPYFALVMDRDPFDGAKTGELWSLYPNIKEWGYGVVPDSTLIVWDAHFGPNECRIPLDTLRKDPHFAFVKAFKPAQEIKVLGGYTFEVELFCKRSEAPPKP